MTNIATKRRHRDVCKKQMRGIFTACLATTVLQRPVDQAVDCTQFSWHNSAILLHLHVAWYCIHVGTVGVDNSFV